MSSESDSEVFFDAEDTTPVRIARIKNKNLQADEKISDISVVMPTDASLQLFNSDVPDSSLTPSIDSENVELPIPVSSLAEQENIIFPVIQVLKDDVKECERKAIENEKRRKKIEELRNRMLTDDDEILEVPSEQSSLASSVDGFLPNISLLNLSRESEVLSQNTDESKSVMSLGKVGLILGEKDTCDVAKKSDSISCDSKFSASETGELCELSSAILSQRGFKQKREESGPEPDLVASTKSTIEASAKSISELVPRPVAPPRTKRRKLRPQAAQTPTDVSESSDVAEISSPTTDNADTLSREFEYSLDINSATRGQYVVKPQDQEQNRGEGPRESISQLPEGESISNGDNIITVQPSSSLNRKCSAKRDLKEEASYIVRTRTDSGRALTDQEILEQVKVLNLDTGEQIPLSLAEEHLPKCLNPLSLHIMRITSEYVSNTALDKERESDEESLDSKKTESLDASRVWSRTKEITKQLGRNIETGVSKLKTVVVDKVHHARHQDDDLSDDDGFDPKTNVEVKISSKLKSVDRGKSEFEKLKVVQELSGEHLGAIWSMKFSSCGRLLATAGQDHDLRIWVLKEFFKYFDDMRQKFAEDKSPTPSQESSPTSTLEASVKSLNVEKGNCDIDSGASSNGDSLRNMGATSNDSDSADTSQNTAETNGPFMPTPFCCYKGHTAELLDISWSKNYFILSSSMDKTVRLWHISRQECLCCFQHIDFVTAIAFHPRDDRYFLSGSLDGKLRLWNIPDKKVTLWNELDGQIKLITAVNFCRNGKIAAVGAYDGRCVFYNTDQLKYYTQIHVRSSRGKNKIGRKISGIEAMPGEDKILITSNDSRIRLYDLRDLSLSCKYRGFSNQSSQIKASFSHDGRYIISGSENHFIYIWKTFHDYAKFSRRDRNDYWERVKAHTVGVTSAVFAPEPLLVLKQCEDYDASNPDINVTNCYVLVSADFTGTIKVFIKV